LEKDVEEEVMAQFEVLYYIRLEDRGKPQNPDNETEIPLAPL